MSDRSFEQNTVQALQTADDYDNAAVTLEGKFADALSSIESLNGKVSAEFFNEFKNTFTKLQEDVVAKTITELRGTAAKLKSTAEQTEAFSKQSIQ